MRISDVLIEDKIKEKVLNKHNVGADEIEEAIFSNPLILKSREDRYIAVGHHQRYLTVIFEVHRNTAFIITAYPSTETQIQLYKQKR